jgi:TRAP-type mannitol/chloroaromatic compound transport system permease small subunit
MLPPSWFGRLTAVMNVIGSCLIIFVMLIILADVCGRYFFSQPVRGVPEMVAMSIAAIVFLQFPHTLRAGRVIFTDGFLNWLARAHPRTEQSVLGVYHLLGAGMFAVIVWALVPLLRRTIETNDFFGVTGVFTFPKWPAHTIILIGAAVMTIQYFTLAVAFFRAAAQARRLNADLDPSERVVS